MTLTESLQAIAKGWKVLVIGGLLGLVLAGLLAWRTDTSYVSNARLFVAAASNSEKPEELFQRNQIATQRLASYVELVSSDAVAAEANRILREGSGKVSAHYDVTASTVPNTVIIDLQVTGATPKDAEQVAAAYLEAVPKVISRIEEVGDQRAAQVSVTPIVEPKLGVPTKQSPHVQLFLGAVLGVVLGAGYVLIQASMRRGTRGEALESTPGRD